MSRSSPIMLVTLVTQPVVGMGVIACCLLLIDGRLVRAIRARRTGSVPDLSRES